MADLARAGALVSGLVQGVFYRQSALGEAQRLGLSGWVQNLPDGRVELVVEGERGQIVELLDWCRRGPPRSRVDEVKVVWGAYAGEFRTFMVLR
jgi:acylphosphatase